MGKLIIDFICQNSRVYLLSGKFFMVLPLATKSSGCTAQVEAANPNKGTQQLQIDHFSTLIGFYNYTEPCHLWEFLS